MKVYRSKKTGNFLRTECIIHSEYWEDVTPKEKPVKKTKKEK